MSINDMNKDALVNKCYEIAEIIEQLINQDIEKRDVSTYNKDEILMEQLLISIQHIRNIFGVSTEMGINEYIRKRSYTKILEKIGSEKFYSLKNKDTVFGIKKFKEKCLKEYSFLADNFNLDMLQQKISAQQMYSIVSKKANQTKTILETKDISNYKGDKYLIAENGKLLVDLGKTQFKIDNKVFKILARGYVLPITKDKFFISLLNQDVTLCESYINDINKNIIDIYKFLKGDKKIYSDFSIFTEWQGKSRGVATLIASKKFGNISLANNSDDSFKNYYNKILLNINFSEERFIYFDKSHIWLNLKYYRDKI